MRKLRDRFGPRKKSGGNARIFWDRILKIFPDVSSRFLEISRIVKKMGHSRSKSALLIDRFRGPGGWITRLPFGLVRIEVLVREHENFEASPGSEKNMEESS